MNRARSEPEVIVGGTARLSGPSACVTKTFKVRVTGTRIAKVVFKIDGKKVKTFRNAAGEGKRFALSVKTGKYGNGIHRLTATITYNANAQTKSRTLRMVFERCRKQRIRPEFTG